MQFWKKSARKIFAVDVHQQEQQLQPFARERFG